MTNRCVTLAVGLWLTCVSVASGQTVYEGSEGTSSLLVSHAGQASINFAEKSAKISLVHAVSTPSFRWGGSVKVLMSEGSAVLFESDSERRLPGGEASAFLGYFWSPRQGIVTFNGAAVLVTGRRATYALVDSVTGAGLDTIQHGISVQVLYNAILGLGEVAGVAAGISAGVGNSNNFSDLAKTQVCSTVGANAATTVSRCSERRIGVYRESTGATAAADILIYPRILGSRLGFSGYMRYDAAKNSDIRPGLGVFVAAAGEPLKMLGGVAVEWTAERRRIVLHLGLPL